MKIPFVSFEHMHHPIKRDMLNAFESFYDSEWYILGKYVREFESSYASFNKVKHSVGVSNGLDALLIALKTLNIGDGDEVIVPSNTFIATWLAVSYAGARPVPVEPESATFNLDPTLIEQSITSRTKAIIPVHLYGQACDMDAIMGIASKHKLHVVEDNAQSQGASWNGQLTGSLGDINATSFYPGKNLGALGDAGALTTNNEELAKKAMQLRNYGSAKKYEHELMGYNMRLDECQAALLSVKLKHLSPWIQQRQQIASWYYEALRGVGDLELPTVASSASHVYHLFVIRTHYRDSLQENLNKSGIGTLVHYPVPPHLQMAYRSLGFERGAFPIAEQMARTCLSLPIWPGLTNEDVHLISNAIKTFFENEK